MSLSPLPPLSPLSPLSPALRSPRKRCHEASVSEDVRGRENRSVRFSHIDIRMCGREIQGGGGVPGDDGPPLGLSWTVEDEQRVALDEYETQRLSSRRPKETYCSIGCVEPHLRTQILLQNGSTPRQINSIKKEVAKLNRERWQASEVLFNQSWLFSAGPYAEIAEILAMIGQTDSEGIELHEASWCHPIDFGKAIAEALHIGATDLLPDDQSIDWARLCGILQGVRRQLVFLIDCTSGPDVIGMQLIGRFVACVHTTHVAEQMSPGLGCRLSVVLRGYQWSQVVADWSDDEADEFCVAALD
uniref:Uncharacterized protein n=1 Tax=Prymnesium polylepis TaxID=72548 RepID=A0A6V4PBZ3_9EUKA|mmetsp:Transcript_10394/g.27613  ORF Transcript_10394/g.27613 Transcript_10394/m.27613 type:complete len:302 (-) Transcript_10394:68-973(-)